MGFLEVVSAVAQPCLLALCGSGCPDADCGSLELESRRKPRDSLFRHAARDCAGVAASDRLRSGHPRAGILVSGRLGGAKGKCVLYSGSAASVSLLSAVSDWPGGSHHPFATL